MSILTGQFPSVRKISKVIPIHKKQSKIHYANYRPISLLLSNIEKIIEKPMYKWLPNFLDTNNLIYSLQFGFRQKYSTTHLLTLFRMGFFGAAHGWWGEGWVAKRPHKSYNDETWHSYTLGRSKKCINHVTHPLGSADISTFSPEIIKFCYIKKSTYRLDFDT